MSVFDILNKIKSVINISSESNKFVSLNQKIQKIDQDILIQNRIEHFKFNALKLNGNNEILLIIVGYNGSISGYNNKYFNIANKANELYGNTVFIVDNNECNWYSPENFFHSIINYVKENMLNKEIKIKLMGTSAGATLALYYAWKYPEIVKMLLINPPLVKENFELTVNSMKLNNGNATLVIGKKDPSYEFGVLLTQERYKNIFEEIVLYDNADHDFKGLINEFINLPFQYLYNRISLLI